MIMDVILQDGPRPVEISPEPDALAQRSGAGDNNTPRLWLVTVTLEIRAPVSWWKQARGYFSEVLWIRARPDEEAAGERRFGTRDFEEPVPEAVLDHLNRLVETGARSSLQSRLPASFIRRGVVHTNLSVLRDIMRERGHYNDGHWASFCRFLRNDPVFDPVHGAGETGRRENSNEN